MTITLQKRDAPIDLSKVANVDLRKKAEAVQVSLAKRGADRVVAQVMLFLDHSASMAGQYRDGSVQLLTERALGYALVIDDDGEIPVLAFDWPKARREDWNRRYPGRLTIPEHEEHIANLDNYQGFVNREVFLGESEMGGTDALSAVEHIHATLDLIEEVGANVPVFLVMVFDGMVEEEAKFVAAMRRLSGRACFVKLLVVAEAGRPLAEYLDNNLNGVVDNVDAKFFTGSGLEDDLGRISDVSDEVFAEAMADEVDSWMSDATAKNILQ